MSHRKLLKDLESLPDGAQRQVLEFIASLKRQFRPLRSTAGQPAGDLSKDAFIGMWRKRTDLKDSSDWVRKTRKREWRDT